MALDFKRCVIFKGASDTYASQVSQAYAATSAELRREQEADRLVAVG